MLAVIFERLPCPREKEDVGAQPPNRRSRLRPRLNCPQGPSKDDLVAVMAAENQAPQPLVKLVMLAALLAHLHPLRPRLWPQCRLLQPFLCQ